MLLPLLVVLAAAAQSVSPSDSAPPNLIGRVVRACRESGVFPGIGPGWQVDLLVVSLPQAIDTTGVVAGKRTPVYARRGARSLSRSSADAVVLGDELEVWHDGSYAIDAVQSPPGIRTYSANRVVIRRRGDRSTRRTPADTLPACQF